MHGPRFLERATWLSLHLIHSMDALLHTGDHADALARHLSRIKGVSPRPNPNGVVFFACDMHFMERFGRALICSCYENARECGVHVHLYEPTPQILEDLHSMQAQFRDMPLTYTYEDDIDFGALPDRGMYYTAFRFVAVRKILADSRSLVMCLDADSLIVSSLRQVLAEARQCDVGLYFRLRKWRLNKKIAAFCAIFNHTPGALDFLGVFGAIAMKFRRHYMRFRSDFYFDQSGLYFAYVVSRLKGNVSFYSIQKTVIDYDFADPACIWTAKGRRKHDDVFLEQSQRMMEKHRAALEGAADHPV